MHAEQKTLRLVQKTNPPAPLSGAPSTANTLRPEREERRHFQARLIHVSRGSRTAGTRCYTRRMYRHGASRALLVSLSVSLPLVASAQEARLVPKPVACDNDHETCRESCTIEFGSSFRAREKLGTCLDECAAKHARCTEQWTELHRTDVGPPAEERTPKPAPEPDSAVEEVTEPLPQAREDARVILPSDEQLEGPPPAKKKPRKKAGTREASRQQ